MTEEIIRRTRSICPECMKTIDAEIYVDPKTDFVMMRKTCEEHGEFKEARHPMPLRPGEILRMPHSRLLPDF